MTNLKLIERTSSYPQRRIRLSAVFEELIRKSAELSNETAGEHFTPREVIRLMVNLLFIEDDQALTKPGVVRTIYDPTVGTGGMPSVAAEYPDAGTCPNWPRGSVPRYDRVDTASQPSEVDNISLDSFADTRWGHQIL